ncbi:hypothetical protein ACIRS1_20170 [Kitasatospora sp. NPDC101176]|uniref:hypothetical protein n=1 Tax=Kitasatospora sp. NPDC101176 TaxID=3364099 RepID=UPI003806FD3F
MHRNSVIRYGRRLAWVPAAALTAAVLTGCSSSSPKNDSAAPPATTAATAPATGATGPATTAGTPPTGAPTAATPPTGAPGTPAPAGKRPADACTLLTSPQVVQAIGTTGPFTGTHPDPGTDGTRPWGCTWGSRESYAAVREVPPSTLATVQADPDLTVTPINGAGRQAVLATRKGGGHPVVYLQADGHVYSVEAVKSRAPGDEANAPAEVVAETVLAGVLATRLAS